MDELSAKNIPHWVPPALAFASTLLFIGIVMWTLVFSAGNIGEALEPQLPGAGTGDYPPIDVHLLGKIAPRLDLELDDTVPSGSVQPTGEEGAGGDGREGETDMPEEAVPAVDE